MFCLVNNPSPYWFRLEPSLSMRVHLARGLSPYSFRVSRVLVKRASRSQENMHFHAYYLFMNFRELWVRWIVTPNSDEYFNWVMKPSPQSSKKKNSMFPTKRSLGDGMSRGLHHPWRELFEKSSVYIAKQSTSRPTKKKNQKSNREQAFETYNASN